MSNSERLGKFLKEYAFSAGWTTLRPIQEAAADVIFDTSHNLLLSCGTSSGKTEAAFFPILTLLEGKRTHGISVLYIAPLKALINDQFERISEICKKAGISVHHRHGDVGAKSREEFSDNPSGILQITPEALESLLMGNGRIIPELFSSLEYVVIDELHAFLGSDRGGQVFCQISRIMKAAEVTPRLIGLSATIGSTKEVCEALSRINGIKTDCPTTESEGLSVSLLYEYFDTIGARDDFIYDAVKKKNSLVFSNSREETEKITTSLRAINEKKGGLGDIFIHHGSISASLRHDAERALKSSSGHAVVCATSTLELGIDIGRLERVVSLGTPNTVSSFLQRLGRSGRRGNTPEMLCAFIDESQKESADRYDILPFELLQGIAIVELYRRERFVEPPSEKAYPYSLLCHQTLSVLASSVVGLLPSELARTVLTLPPFSKISFDDYKAILSHLSQKGYIEKTDDGRLIIGLRAESIIGSFRFYSVFKQEETYTVKDEDGREIGEISEAITPGGRFALAGRTWVCERLDSEARVIYARAARGKMTSYHHGSLVGIDDKIAQYTKKILSEDEIYPYLGKNAARVLKGARQIARKNRLLEYPLHRIDEDLWIIMPWLGTRSMNTLSRLIRKTFSGGLVSKVTIENPFVLSFRMDVGDLRDFLAMLKRSSFDDNELNITLLDESEVVFTEKYDYLVPKPLLRKAYACDRMSAKAIHELIKGM